MIIKKAHQGEFKTILGAIRLAILNNKTVVSVTKKKRNYTPILTTIQRLGYIDGYEEREELIIIFLKQIYWKNFHLPTHSLSVVRKVRLNTYGTVKARELTKTQRRGGESIDFILSTDKGIKTGLECLSEKRGGIPLFKIY